MPINTIYSSEYHPYHGHGGYRPVWRGLGRQGLDVVQQRKMNTAVLSPTVNPIVKHITTIPRYIPKSNKVIP